jgi:hypothetical protein
MGSDLYSRYDFIIMCSCEKKIVMKFSGLISFIVLIGFARCDNEMEFATIYGGWHGTTAEFRFNLTPIHEDDFNLSINFFKDGTVSVTKGSESVTGTYEKDEEYLYLNGIIIHDLPVGISGKYEIKRLTDETLVLHGVRYSEYNDPALGLISGKVDTTLSFQRVVN